MHYVTNPQAIHETIEGETIVIDLVSGTYYSLQGAGAEVWNLLVSGHGREEIVEGLAHTYSLDRAELDPAIGGFLDQLETERLIAPSAELAATNGRAAPSLAAAAYVPPALEKYTDMQDIILLDPVHKVDDRGWPHPAPADA